MKWKKKESRGYQARGCAAGKWREIGNDRDVGNN